jgi:hypothetical protein
MSSINFQFLVIKTLDPDLTSSVAGSGGWGRATKSTSGSRQGPYIYLDPRRVLYRLSGPDLACSKL